METNRILQFRAIVETGNFRKAAELLNVSHSGLSKSMKVLENELGYPLFQPSGRGVVVSDRGKLFFERSNPFFDAYNQLIGDERHGPKRAFRLGSFETFTSYFIGPLIREHLADQEIEIHELVPGRLEEALVLDKVDLGITYEPVPRQGIEYVKAASLKMGAYALNERFDELDLEQIPFITPVNPLEGASSGVKGRDAWPDDKMRRQVRYRVDSMAMGLEIARQGLAAIYIAQFVARLHNERSRKEFHLVPLKLKRLVPMVKRDVYIVKRDSTVENRTLRLIARALRQVCND